MTATPLFIGISIAVLAVVAVLVFLLGGRREANRLSPLASLAFGFVLAGILFGEERAIGYSLLGVGVLLSIVDMLSRSRNG